MEAAVFRWRANGKRLGYKGGYIEMIHIGTSICCVVSDGDVCVSYWHTGEGGRWFYTNGEYDCNVTHWMLLPPLPDLPSLTGNRVSS